MAIANKRRPRGRENISIVDEHCGKIVYSKQKKESKPFAGFVAQAL